MNYIHGQVRILSGLLKDKPKGDVLKSKSVIH